MTRRTTKVLDARGLGRLLSATSLSCERGSVAVMFGLALIPLALAGGLALDYARARSARTAMSTAADGAALAAARLMHDGLPGNGAAAGEAFARAALQGHNIRGLAVRVTGTTDGARAEVRGKVHTSLLGAVGFQDIDVSIVAEAI